MSFSQNEESVSMRLSLLPESLDWVFCLSFRFFGGRCKKRAWVEVNGNGTQTNFQEWFIYSPLWGENCPQKCVFDPWIAGCGWAAWRCQAYARPRRLVPGRSRGLRRSRPNGTPSGMRTPLREHHLSDCFLVAKVMDLLVYCWNIFNHSRPCKISDSKNSIFMVEVNGNGTQTNLLEQFVYGLEFKIQEE